LKKRGTGIDLETSQNNDLRGVSGGHYGWEIKLRSMTSGPCQLGGDSGCKVLRGGGCPFGREKFMGERKVKNGSSDIFGHTGPTIVWKKNVWKSGRFRRTFQRLELKSLSWTSRARDRVSGFFPRGGEKVGLRGELLARWRHFLVPTVV